MVELLDGGVVQLDSQNNPSSNLYELSKKRRWSELIFDDISEEVLEEWREEGAAPAGSEEGVVPAEWREKMLQQGLRKELV